MTTFPGAPKLLKAGLVLLDPRSAAVGRIITLQYNPASLTRTFQVRSVGDEGGDRSMAMRIPGPPIETLSLEAEIDATDQLEFPDENPTATEAGILPQLAALEGMIYPRSGKLEENNTLAKSGTLEIVPMEAPLSLFIWSKHRVVPVRPTEITVTEEAFDPMLNPLRAKVSLGLRVLSVDDLGFEHKGGSLFMTYLKARENLADQARGGDLGAFGIGEIS